MSGDTCFTYFVNIVILDKSGKAQLDRDQNIGQFERERKLTPSKPSKIASDYTFIFFLLLSFEETKD